MSSRSTKALARSCKLACCFEAIAFTSGLKLRRLPGSSVILALRQWLSPRKCSVMAASLGPRLAAKKPRAQKEPTRGLTSALGRAGFGVRPGLNDAPLSLFRAELEASGSVHQGAGALNPAMIAITISSDAYATIAA